MCSTFFFTEKFKWLSNSLACYLAVHMRYSYRESANECVCKCCFPNSSFSDFEMHPKAYFNTKSIETMTHELSIVSNWPVWLAVFPCVMKQTSNFLFGFITYSFYLKTEKIVWFLRQTYRVELSSSYQTVESLWIIDSNDFGEISESRIFCWNKN